MATKIKTPIPIPFEHDGSLLPYAELKYPDVTKYPSNSYELAYWKDNYTFTDTLIFKGISSGRSAISHYFKSETTGSTYHCFASNLKEIVDNMVRGKITADFTFVKKGSNYGMMMVPGTAK